MIAVLSIIASVPTSSTSSVVRRPFYEYVQEEEEEDPKVPFVVEEEQDDLQNYRAYVAHLRQERWDADRKIRATFGAAVLVQIAGTGMSILPQELGAPFGAGLALSIGLRRRLSPSLELQSHSSINVGVARFSGLDSDFTLRIAKRRFFYGFGPMFRTVFPHFEARPLIGSSMGSHELAFGGGLLFEIGALLLGERTLDMAIRVSGGITAELDGSRNGFFVVAYSGSYPFLE